MYFAAFFALKSASAALGVANAFPDSFAFLYAAVSTAGFAAVSFAAGREVLHEVDVLAFVDGVADDFVPHPDFVLELEDRVPHPDPDDDLNDEDELLNPPPGGFASTNETIPITNNTANSNSLRHTISNSFVKISTVPIRSQRRTGSTLLADFSILPQFGTATIVPCSR